MTEKIKAAVWDIGGVLLDDPKIGAFWKGINGSEELRNDFASGRLSVEEFISRGAKLLRMPEEDFLSSYKEAYFSVKPMKPSLKIYENMKTNRYILSDTNPLHMKFIRENFPNIFRMSKKNYFSPEIKMMKDSEKVFEYVSGNLNLNPSQILLIDNKDEIIDYAKSAGWNAIHFVDSLELEKDLKKLGVN